MSVLAFSGECDVEHELPRSNMHIALKLYVNNRGLRVCMNVALVRLGRVHRVTPTDLARVLPEVNERRGLDAALVKIALGASQGAVVASPAYRPAVVAREHKHRVVPHVLLCGDFVSCSVRECTTLYRVVIVWRSRYPDRR